MTDLRAKVISQIQEMLTTAEFTSTVSNLSTDINQKLFDMRSDILARANELNKQTVSFVQ